MQVNGDLTNIKTYMQKKLEGIYELFVPIGQLSTKELNEKMLEITEHLGREIAVYINRQGKILQVSLGEADTVSLVEFRKQARSDRRLSGIRCVHTHPNGDVRLSELDLSSLRQLRFDCMVAIGRHPKEGVIGTMGFFTGEQTENGMEKLRQCGPFKEKIFTQININKLICIINKKLISSNKLKNTNVTIIERALLAGIEQSGRHLWSIEESMSELECLADTAGATIVGRFTQRKEKPDAAFFLGKGKVAEIATKIQNTDANLLILDDELTPSQQHNLEKSLGIKVIDRTALILDIFAQHARSREGKLQVELAQLKYNLSRLGGQGTVLSRLGGGIGTRGPGETKLEIDRRRIYTKIHEIEKQMERLQKSRNLCRERRKESRIPHVALVGYTNAGKSTLLNKLTSSEVLAEDKLFATLDPTTRHFVLPEKQDILLTDTVGFIQKLPHTLVAAFRATLEEIQDADLLLHVVNCSNENFEQQIIAVTEVLKELELGEKPIFYIFNKADQIDTENFHPQILHDHESILVSARTGKNLDLLQKKIENFFQERQIHLTLLIPYDKGNLITDLHGLNAVHFVEYMEQGTLVEAYLPVSEKDKYLPYSIVSDSNRKE